MPVHLENARFNRFLQFALRLTDGQAIAREAGRSQRKAPWPDGMPRIDA